MPDAPANENDLVYFAVSSPREQGFTPHVNVSGQLTRTLAELQEEWTRVLGQLDAMFRADDGVTHENGFRVHEVAVGLTFTASGKLAFVAEAGVEASITVTLTRD